MENYNLTVTLVKEEDGGEYEVRAENEMGSVSSKSTVTVHSKYNTYLHTNRKAKRSIVHNYSYFQNIHYESKQYFISA